MNRDLEFLSGHFFEYEVPKEKRYLLKYFKTDLQKAFLKYFFVFGEHRNFLDHTGQYCNWRFVYQMEKRLHQIIEAYEKAKRSLTEESMELLQKIESGKFRLTKKLK